MPMLSTSPFIRAFAVTALIGGMALAAPSFATPSASPSSQDEGSATAMVKVANPGKSAKETPEQMAQNVENRIKTLHAKLNITPDQEGAWNDFAQAMRDSEANVSSAVQSRHQSASTMSAVDDLASYQKIAQAHADGMQKVATAFEPLYDSMSDDQKKNADQVFGQWEGHRGVAKASGKKSSMSPSSSPSAE